MLLKSSFVDCRIFSFSPPDRNSSNLYKIKSFTNELVLLLKKIKTRSRRNYPIPMSLLLFTLTSEQLSPDQG